MSMLETLKAEHMVAADKRWEDAIVRIKRMLEYPDAKVRTLTYRLMCLDGLDRFNMFGGDGRTGTKGYYHLAVGSTPCTIMEETAQFVSHELLDDGSPAIGYHRYDLEGRKGAFQPCDKDAKGAKPYFHYNIEVLQETYPKAKYADVDAAIKVLDWYDAQEAKRAKTYRLPPAAGQTEPRIITREPSKETVAMRALVDEIVQSIEAAQKTR